MTKKLLVIEDEKSVSKQLKWGLENDYDITIVADAPKAWKMLNSGAFQVATLDLGLPPQPDSPDEGFKLLKKIQGSSLPLKIIVITGNSEEQNAIRAVQLGASDFCEKPLDLNLLKIILARTFRIFELEESNRQLRAQSLTEGSLQGMIGSSKIMKKLFGLLQNISSTDYPVLITGSSGTGKEKAAQAVHNLSPRKDHPFIIINCGAIPENLLESELFGHEKGAFTGAVVRKTGKFELADKGTCFLDEVGELPLQLQVKLLRMLQENTIERVGGTQTIKLDVRIITATNVDLEQAVKEGNFREDFYHRLNVLPVHLPPLKDRGEDIFLLAHHFLREESEKLQKGQTTFSSAAIAALATHSWPGNVRELQNRIRRAISLSSDPLLYPENLGLSEKENNEEQYKILTLKESREKAEKMAILNALALTDNNISKAAKLLETSRPTLHDLIKKHNVLNS